MFIFLIMNQGLNIYNFMIECNSGNIFWSCSASGSVVIEPGLCPTSNWDRHSFERSCRGFPLSHCCRYDSHSMFTVTVVTRARVAFRAFCMQQSKCITLQWLRSWAALQALETWPGNCRKRCSVRRVFRSRHGNKHQREIDFWIALYTLLKQVEDWSICLKPIWPVVC